MKWMDVNKEKPRIPKGKYAITVLTVLFDSMYESLCGKEGRYVSTSSWNGKKWMGQCINISDNSMVWKEDLDVVTHWMYLPKLPTTKQIRRKNEKS